jgi:hypothetical protein
MEQKLAVEEKQPGRSPETKPGIVQGAGGLVQRAIRELKIDVPVLDWFIRETAVSNRVGSSPQPDHLRQVTLLLYGGQVVTWNEAETTGAPEPGLLPVARVKAGSRRKQDAQRLRDSLPQGKG